MLKFLVPIFFLGLSFTASAQEYKALLSCGIRGEHYDLIICLADTQLEVRLNNRTQIYRFWELEAAGFVDRYVLNIDLPNSFAIQAQNSHNYYTLTLQILNKSGEVIFEDQAGEYGFVGVRN